MLAPEYTITDSEDTVSISVTFQGRTAAKCDLVVADLYAKFNLSPYFLMVDFPELVSPNNVCASAKVNTLSLRIKKEKAGMWPEQPWTFGKEELKQRREESFQRLLSAERARIEAERVAKEQAEKEAMHRAWDVEKQQREALKEAEEEAKQKREAAEKDAKKRRKEAEEEAAKKKKEAEEEAERKRQQPPGNFCGTTVQWIFATAQSRPVGRS